MSSPSQLTPADPIDADAAVSLYTGQMVYFSAFDIAYEMTRQPVTSLLGEPLVQYRVDASKRSPRQLLFYSPQTVHLPPLECSGPDGPVQVERTIKILPVGAISITVRVPFRVSRLQDLVKYHEIRINEGSLREAVRQLAERAHQELIPHSNRPVERLGEEEAYTVFCIDSPLVTKGGTPLGAEDWLHLHIREVAAVLTQEHDVTRLSDQEANESTGRYLSYYDRDLVVMDWDAALIVDELKYWDETLYIMELANLQLAELEAYDRTLDRAVDRSYRDLAARRVPRRRELQANLQEIRIDMARLSDELSNITKFFGDWHLARIYQGLSDRFHLADWHREIDEKLRTLDHLYGLHKQDQNNRWMLILEVTIVLLFIIDLLILIIGLGKH